MHFVHCSDSKDAAKNPAFFSLNGEHDFSGKLRAALVAFYSAEHPSPSAAFRRRQSPAEFVQGQILLRKNHAL